jgi:hypothetical protein
LSIVGDYPVSRFLKDNYVINISAAKYQGSVGILQVINSKSQPLSSYATVSTGLKAYQIGKGKPIQNKDIKDSRAFHVNFKKNDSCKRYLEGRDVSRYHVNWSKEFLHYGDWLAEPRKSVPFDGPRILVRQIPSKPPKSINAAYVCQEYVHDINSMVIFGFVADCNPLYLMAVLNSAITTYWFVYTFDKFQRKTFPQFRVKELAMFPIPKADFQKQEEIAEKAKKLLALHEELHDAPSGSEASDMVKFKIGRVDEEIEELVCQLYGLNVSDIKKGA